mgnify:CR=1 FL=1
MVVHTPIRLTAEAGTKTTKTPEVGTDEFTKSVVAGVKTVLNFISDPGTVYILVICRDARTYSIVFERVGGGRREAK